MTTFVIDASVVVKWVIEEPGTPEAVALLKGNTLIAPELIVAECANILWKKARRGELSAAEARFAALLIESSDLHLRETLPFLVACTELAVKLDHPAYDCLYLVLALNEGIRLVTADESLVRKLRQNADERLRQSAILLSEIA